ncbi:lipopolysaccharide heptosyltransferase I [Salinispirillum sp. LH 10-3-1]|uniref:Lipopolysaccharide heptosyltransferase 1 n=1 Tax=Salinispirillum sp. LH 10-3-1 TaxID=2952525 RepID=A0AB38YJE8_9GAMM
MRILLIKMSSMGDIFHTFPALSDLQTQLPNAEIDWVVEDAFSGIAAWHPAVRKVIPIALRKWRKAGWRTLFTQVRQWRESIQESDYDLVIDAQGLLKSSLIARVAGAKKLHGYDNRSAREPIATKLYHQTHYVSTEQHAVERTRQLFAAALGYSLDDMPLTFGIRAHFAHIAKAERKLVLIVGTSWSTKLWASEHWKTLTANALQQGYAVEVIWGSPEEKALADEIIQACPQATCASERLSIQAAAEKLVEASAVVGLDTGFAHLAGALESRTVALYGATSPTKVGLIGAHTDNLSLTPALDCMPCHKRSCAKLPVGSQDTPPCMQGLMPEHVVDMLQV